ncbi:MAG TPA: hypothetical protein DCK93_00815 [Blastocatellia bacterium]|jgi:hypothetical protein|nr:hypothetical protein [Blastocatellia bacterium]
MTTAAEASSTEQVSSTTATAPVPKRITNAQTVCNEKNEKGKLCNGHLKQLRTAGELAEIHLRGDDVLFKCQTCGTFYMGPPLGHVRDPQKQSRFVEAELSALLQAAGGTLPVIKKDARGVFVMETTGHAPAPAKPAAAPTAPAQPAVASAPKPAAPKAAAAAPSQKSAAPKAGAEPNRQLNKRSTYAGVADTGPVAGETFEQKVARLKAVAAGAKQRAEEGGGPVAPAASAAPTVAEAAAPSIAAPEVQQAAPASVEPEPSEVDPAATAPAAASVAAVSAEHKPTGQADRTLMLRSTYCGVVDTGPVAGETFEQKVERLRALAAAAKQRADGG